MRMLRFPLGIDDFKGKGKNMVYGDDIMEMGLLSILQIRVTTVFMLDPDIPMLLNKLAGRGYVTARVRHTLDGATITFIEPPNVIAGRGAVRVDYDFSRKVLGVEGSSPKEVLHALDDVEDCLKELIVDVEKALIPYEAIVVAEASFKPKFTGIKCALRDLLGFDLRLMEGGFVREYGDPASNRWFYLKVSPIWSSYRVGGEENLYRVSIVYRDEKSKLVNFIGNVEDILRKLLEGV
jgi:hypothetical protein